MTIDLPLALSQAVYVAMMAGIVLIVAVPFFPGLAVILVALLLYVGYASYTIHALAGMPAVPLAIISALCVVGLTSESWSERLGIRFAYMDSQVLAFATIFSFVGVYMFGILGLVAGLFLGALIGEMQTRKSFPDAVQRALAAIMSALGPRGFQLLMAILVSGMVMNYLSIVSFGRP